MSVCIAAEGGSVRVAWCGAAMRVRVRVYDTHPLFPCLCRLAEAGETPKEGRGRVVPMEWGGENKLISLTQPAVTPPQHDINPKPRLSLFKLYESLRAPANRGNFVGGSRRPSRFATLFRSHIPSLVGYKQEYIPREEGKTLPCSRNIFTTVFSNIFISNLSQRDINRLNYKFIPAIFILHNIRAYCVLSPLVIIKCS